MGCKTNYFDLKLSDKDGFKPVTSPSFTYPPTTVIPAGQCPIAKECDSDVIIR